MINYEYSELVYQQYLLANNKNKSKQQESEFINNGDKLLQFEKKLSSNDIFESVREAFKHIPPRL